MILLSDIEKCDFIDKNGSFSTERFSSVSTDSRSLSQGEVFICLVGENFDGSRFADEALKKQAALLVLPSSEAGKEAYQKFKSKIDTLLVEDSDRFYGQLAHHHTQRWKSESQGQVIGIVGSNGKTTTKEILSFLLKQVYSEKVHSSEKNFNNHIGVPKTLLSLKSQHSLCVLEMGTNHPGEIQTLCEIADPDMGIITNIGHEHMEFFKTLEGVFREESTLYEYLSSKGRKTIIPHSDTFLSKLNGKEGVVSYGEEGDFLCQATNDKLILLPSGNEFSCPSLVGEHNYSNLAASLALIERGLGGKAEDYKEGFANYSPLNNRSSFFSYLSKLIFLDAYNANPSSMKAGLLAFKELVLKRGLSLEETLIIIGDMNELGEESESFHKEIGEFLVKEGFQKCVFIGRFSKNYEAGFGKKAFHSFATVGEYGESLFHEDLKNSSAAFLKGSRSLQLESLIEKS